VKRVFAAFVILCFSTSVLGSELAGYSSLDSSPRAMLYFHVPMGAKPGKASLPTFGLRLDEEFAPLNTGNPYQFGARPSLALVDLRLNSRGDVGVALSGGLLYDSDSDSDSWGKSESWNNFWFWALLVGGAVGISCLAGAWPCEDSNGGYNAPSSPGN